MGVIDSRCDTAYIRTYVTGARQNREPDSFRRSSKIMSFLAISKAFREKRGPKELRKRPTRGNMNVGHSGEKAVEQKSDLKGSFFILLGAKIVELPGFIKHKHNMQKATNMMRTFRGLCSK